ncbi:hypothetical protein COV15_02885 [Candidatus Woesearchaeota archaeon CG10_big_fil_rev_8_21_14_0_10_34_12]|nr:MAG: hypothetical protein COV15_02885 [Candidatus Woesearchaeota archaeon CG10_big_fil_rev_8_21_14_0_10_34_12]
MLPKSHIVLGAIFSLVLFYFFHFTFSQISLVFLASVLIDFDHFLFYFSRNKNLNLKKAYYWHKAIIYDHKPIVQTFHTVEFLILILLLSFIWKLFIFVFIGMIFHSAVDIIDIYSKVHKLSPREFFLTRYFLTTDKTRYF